MSVIDMHAHYVSPELIREAGRNGERYGVRIENLDPTLRDRLSSGANGGIQIR